MVETRGNLESLSVVNGTVELTGWVASLASGPVGDFAVTCGGRELLDMKVERELPSADVKKVHPSLDFADRCRFRVKGRLDGIDSNRVKKSAVTCTPLFGDGTGRIMIRLFDPAIPMPDQKDIDLIGDGFVDVSSEFLGYFIQLAGLTSKSSVLDVGCGVGRMAYMLAHYLDPSARYEGFDIMGNLIPWAQNFISSKAPQLKFQHVNVYNKHYNPQGTCSASEFRFPFEDNTFDLVFLTSVFTHMFPDDVRHYLDEFRRVLKPGGRCLTTCFLLNEESRALVKKGKCTQKLVHQLKECYTTTPQDPEASIGYDESLLLSWIAERGMTLESKHYGCWCERPKFSSYQDILVYRKPLQQALRKAV